MSDPGAYRDRLSFEKRSTAADDYGSVAGAWSAQFTRNAHIREPGLREGREAVIAARLQGTMPVEIEVRFDDETRTITPDWRAVDTRDGTIYAIRTAADLARTKQFMTITAEMGVAP